MTATTDTTGKVRVDMQLFTFRELDEASQVIFDKLGVPMAEAMTGPRGQWAAAVMAWIAIRRTDPAFTLDDALDMPFGQIEMVNPDPEAQGGGNGVAPASSPATGP